MSFSELVIALAAIVVGGGFVIYVAKNIFDLIKIQISKKSSSGAIDPQFFKALGDFKKNTERRIANLESIVADLEEEKIRIYNDSTSGKIEIEDKELRSSEEDIDDSNLKNMLNE